MAGIVYIVEQDCQGCGLCEDICPEVFRLDEKTEVAEVVTPRGGPKTSFSRPLIHARQNASIGRKSEGLPENGCLVRSRQETRADARSGKISDPLTRPVRQCSQKSLLKLIGSSLVLKRRLIVDAAVQCLENGFEFPRGLALCIEHEGRCRVQSHGSPQMA